MADKVVSGIGRELRYLEYKLRKKQAAKKNKKDKNGGPPQDLAWSDSTRTDDSPYTGVDGEFRKEMPVNSREEDVQIQVALAISRQDEQERARQLEGDKMRLEMAINESIKDAESTKVQQAAQPSLLDVSLNAPGTTASGSVDLFGPTAGNDPWGASAPPAATVMTFDPFAPQQSSVSPQAAAATISTPYTMASNNFPAPTNTWGTAPQSSTFSQAPLQDPWGVSNTQSPTPQVPHVNSFSEPVANNPWGTPTPVVSAQNMFPPTQNGPWGNSTAPAPSHTASSIRNDAWGNHTSLASTQQVNFDPFSGTSTVAVPQPQNSAFGMTTPALQSEISNPFGMGDSTTFTAPPFDPLKDFDNLHIGSSYIANESAPVLLQRDFAGSQSVANGLFPLDPVPATLATTNGSPAPAPTDSFLGAGSSLVNLDSGWKTYQVPYCAKPLGTASHNPFQQTGPTKSLNEMKSSSKQPGF